MRAQSRWLFVAALALPAGLAFGADRATWDAVDVVPMPKEIQLTGQWVDLADWVIVTGREPCEQSKIGADWINRRLSELRSKPLPVQRADKAAAGRKCIVVGTLSDCSLVKRAAGEGTVNVGPNNPGPRGYEIRPGPRAIYLAGADPVGALYACVTFAELLAEHDGRAAWRAAQVRDWPDFLHVPLSGSRAGSSSIPEIHTLFRRACSGASSPEFREQYLRAMRAHYDRLLRWKVSYLGYACYYKWSRRTPPEARALIREGIEYGKARGIGALVYAEMPFAGLVAENPDAKRTCLPAGRYGGFIRCWSLDDMRRRSAANLAGLVKDLGLTDVGFHDTDTGGYDNPARWNERCETCRKRWGDDYVAATVHKHRIYYDALKEAVPDVRMHVTIYPYGIGILDPQAGVAQLTAKYGGGPAVVEKARELRENYGIFWARMAKEIPPDVTFCIRETLPAAVQRFREIVKPHGVFMWYGLPGKRWRSFFSHGPGWVGTFYRGPNDFLFPQPFGEMFVPIQGLAVREYAWNTRAPGAAPWRSVPADESWKCSEPGGADYDVVLPHVVRNFFGRTAAPQVTEALRLNMEPFQVFEQTHSREHHVLKTAKRMKEQADLAEAGARHLDAVWAQCRRTGTRLGMSDFAFRRFVYLREAFHSTMWMAKARWANLKARELAQAQQMDAAQKAIEDGLATVAMAKQALDRVVQERPDDPVLATRGRNRWADGWRAFMPGWDPAVDMDKAGERLKQTQKELSALGSLGVIPETVMDAFVRRRTIRAVQANGPVRVDGRVDEADWRRAYPVECFLVHTEGKQLSRAHTRSRLLYDRDRLYIAFECWVPGGLTPQAQARGQGESVIGDDSVEVFLKPPVPSGDYVHFMINAAGTVRHQLRRREVRGAVAAYRSDNDWVCPGVEAKAQVGEGRWSLEMSVPFASLNAAAARSRWTANLCRNCPLPGGEHEPSSVLPPGAKDFHDVKLFRPLAWCGEAGYEPAVGLDLAGLKVKPRTFSDRIATVAAFGFNIQASQVLHNVVLRGEAYAADGSLQAKRDLWSHPRVPYCWTATEPCELPFEQVCQSGGVRLVLSADEAQCERWIRFGGWPGTAAVGSVLGKGTDRAGEQDFRRTPSLRGSARFPSSLPLEGRGEPARLLGSRQGTVEFWLRPEWPGLWPPPGGKSEYRQGRHALFHFGVVRPAHPYNTNQLSLSLVHSDRYGGLSFSVTNRRHVNWSVSATVRDRKDWVPGRWHHVALVWDAAAGRNDWLRSYLDGKRASAGVSVGHEDRLGQDKSVRVDADMPFMIQVGSLNTGRAPARACIDELRISRTARYGSDFAPSAREFKLDPDTSVLFHFNRGLNGEGMLPDGTRYPIQADAGPLTYH